MTSEQITREQAAAQPIFFGDDRSWGFGMSVVTRRTDYPSIGTFGWTGGLGTIALTDPKEEMISILMTQRAMDSPRPPEVFTDFITCVYHALGD